MCTPWRGRGGWPGPLQWPAASAGQSGTGADLGVRRRGEWAEGSSVLRLWLPDLANKNTESVKFKFQINNRYLFSI